MDQLPAGTEPLSPAGIQSRSGAPHKGSMDIGVDKKHVDSIEYTVNERPLLVFEGGADGEPAWKKAWIILKHYGLILIGFIFFVVFLGVRINPDDPRTEHQSYTLGTALMMTCWWLSSAVPMAVTSLLPIVVFPLTGVLSSSVTTAQYANEICFLLVGSFMLALVCCFVGLVDGELSDSFLGYGAVEVR